MLDFEPFREALDTIFRTTSVWQDVAFGPFRARAGFADGAEAEAMGSALVPALVPARVPAPDGGAPDLSVAFVCGPDPRLMPLVPRDREVFRVIAEGPFMVMWQSSPWDMLFIHDGESRRGLQWVLDPVTPEGVRCRPALSVLHAFAAPTGWTPLHSAAVGRDGRFLLLAGDGGAGKSTASLACALAGWDYAGDDFVLVEPRARRVEPLYVSGRLRPGSQAALGRLLATTEVSRSNDFNDPRAELRLRPGTPGVRIAGGEIAAILLPRRRGAERVVFTPASAKDALAALLKATALTLPGFRDQLYPKLLATVGCAPRYFVDTGSDPSAIPAAFERFLGEL